MNRAKRVTEYLEIFNGLNIQEKSNLLLAAMVEEQGEWLEIVIQKMNSEIKAFPPKPRGLNEDMYNLMSRVYNGYLSKPGAKEIHVFCGDISKNLNKLYNDFCHLITSWGNCPGIHIQIVSEVWRTSKIVLRTDYKKGREYLDPDTHCIFEIKRECKQINLFNKNSIEMANRFTDRKEKKETKAEETGQVDKKYYLPECLNFDTGDGILIETKNGNHIFALRIPFDRILKRLEENEEVYSEIVKGSGFETKDGELWMKLKAIPLSESKKTEEKTHFLKFDYFVPDPEYKDNNS